VLHSPGDFSLGLVTFSGPPIHRTLLQQTFLWRYLKAQVFTHTLPDINSIKNAIPQEIANVKQHTAMPCPGGHLQEVVLKREAFFVNPRQ
jgi:hypothetical protein